MEEIIEKKKVNVKDEFEKINSETIFEYEKTVDEFDINKIKAYSIVDGEKTVCLLFYDNDFFAINRINYKDGYEYDEKDGLYGISENLNYRIKKIPNVAKTRKILNIEDIETRIYDISEYVVLLTKEKISILRVNSQADIQPIEYNEYELDYKKIEDDVNFLIEEEEMRIREEKNIKNRIRKLAQRTKEIIVEPFKLLKSKLIKASGVKMLSDGKHSIFDDNNEG